jgi:hypothetical protein
MLSIETCPNAQKRVWQSYRVEEMLDAALDGREPLNYLSWLDGLENWDSQLELRLRLALDNP